MDILYNNVISIFNDLIGADFAFTSHRCSHYENKQRQKKTQTCFQKYEGKGISKIARQGLTLSQIK